MNAVENLIPHRHPFLYLDRLITATKDEVVGEMVFRDADHFLRGSFPESGFVPGMVLIEAMAQCGGAGIKQAGLGSGMFGFASIDNALFRGGVLYETEFRMVIKNVKVAEKYFRQTGQGYAQGKVCVEATWTCVKIQ